MFELKFKTIKSEVSFESRQREEHLKSYFFKNVNVDFNKLIFKKYQTNSFQEKRKMFNHVENMMRRKM